MPRLTPSEISRMPADDQALYQRKLTEFEFLQGLGMDPDESIIDDIAEDLRMKWTPAQPEFPQIPIEQQMRIMQRYASPPAPQREPVDIIGLTPGGNPQTVPVQDVQGLRRGNVITQEELTRRLSELAPKSERSLERGGFVSLRDTREAASNDFITNNQAKLDRINALPPGSQQQLDALTAFEKEREDYINQKVQERLPGRADVQVVRQQEAVGGPRQASRFGTPRTRVAPSRIDFQRRGEDIVEPGGVTPGPLATTFAESLLTKVPIYVAETFIPGPRSTEQQRAEAFSILGNALLPQVITTGEEKIQQDVRLKEIRQVAFEQANQQAEEKIGTEKYRAMSPEDRTVLTQKELGNYYQNIFEDSKQMLRQDPNLARQRSNIENYDQFIEALAARHTQQFIREIDPSDTENQTKYYDIYKDKYSFAASDLKEFTAKAVETLFTNANDPEARDKLYRLGLIPDRNTITESTGGTLFRDVNLLFRIFENPIMDSLTTTVDKDGNVIDEDEFLGAYKPQRTVGDVEKGRALEAPTVDVKGQGFAGYMKELGIETARARGLGNDVASLNFLPSSSLDTLTYITTVGELFIPLPGMIAAKGLKLPKLTKSGFGFTRSFGGTKQVIKGTARTRQLTKDIKRLEDTKALFPEAARKGAQYDEVVKKISEKRSARRQEFKKTALDLLFVIGQGYVATPGTMVGGLTELITTTMKANRALRYFDAEKDNLKKLESSLDMSEYAGKLSNVERPKFYEAVLDESSVGHQLVGYQADKLYDLAQDIAVANRYPGQLNVTQNANIQKKRDILLKISQNDETPAMREMAKAIIRDPGISKNRLVEIGLETGAMRNFDDYVLITPNLVMRKDAVEARLPGAIERTNEFAAYEQVGFNQYVFKNADEISFETMMSDTSGGSGYGIEGTNKYLRYIDQKMEKNIPLDIEEIGYVRQYIFEQEIKKTVDWKQERYWTGDTAKRPEVDFTGSEEAAAKTQTYLRDKEFPVEPGAPVERQLREAERTTILNTAKAPEIFNPKNPVQISKEIDRIDELNKQLGKSGKKAIGVSTLPARATRAQERIIDANDQITRQMIPAIKEARRIFGSELKTVDAMITADMKGENFLNILSTPDNVVRKISDAPSDMQRMNEYFYNLTMDMIGNPTSPEARSLVKAIVDRTITQPGSQRLLGSGQYSNTPTGIMENILDEILQQNKSLMQEVASLDDIMLNRTYLNAKRAKTRAIIREELLTQGQYFVDLKPLRDRAGFNSEEAIDFFNESVSRKSVDFYERFELQDYYYNKYYDSLPPDAPGSRGPYPRNFPQVDVGTKNPSRMLTDNSFLDDLERTNFEEILRDNAELRRSEQIEAEDLQKAIDEFNRIFRKGPDAAPLRPASDFGPDIPMVTISAEGEALLKRVGLGRAPLQEKMAYLNGFIDDVVSGKIYDYADDIASQELRLNFNALDATTRDKYSGKEAVFRANYLRQNLQSSARKFLDNDQYIISDPQTRQYIAKLMEDSFGDPATLKTNLDAIARDQYATGAVMRSMAYQLSYADRARTSWVSGQLGGQILPNIAYQAENLITAPLIAFITRPNAGFFTRNPELRAIFKQMPAAAIGQKPQKSVFDAAKSNPSGQYGNTRYTNQEIANAMNTQNLGNTAQATELSRALQVDYQRELRKNPGFIAGAKRIGLDVLPLSGRTTPWMRYAMNVDMSFREAVFLARIKEGDDIAKASRIARDTMLDYGAGPVTNWLKQNEIGKFFLYFSFLESTSRSILKALRQPNGLNRVLRMANYHNKVMNAAGQEKRGLLGDDALQSLMIGTFDIYNPEKTEALGDKVEGYATYLRNPNMGALYSFANFADRTVGVAQSVLRQNYGAGLDEGFKLLEETVYSPYIQAGRMLSSTGERRVPETYLKRIKALGPSMVDYGIVPVDVADQEIGRFASQPPGSDPEKYDPMSGYQYKFREGGYQKFALAMTLMNIIGAERMINDYTYMWAESGALPPGTYFARDENGNPFWVLPEAIGRKRTRRLPAAWEAQDRALRQQLREIQKLQKATSKESLE